MKRVILYINQFFAGVGGEDQADYEPAIHEGPIGPGLALASALKDAEITHTIVCGDNYMNTSQENAFGTIRGFLENIEFDLFLAGPAFQSGRYGMSCGAMCKYISEAWHVPAVTCMHEENPGLDAYRGNPGIYIMKGNKSSVKMRKDAGQMAGLANKIIAGEEILWADAEGYFGHGVRKEVFVERTAADRAVDMLLAKIAGQPYETEYVIEMHDAVTPAKAVDDITCSRVAIVTTGGLVPVGNPDHMPSGTASIWKTYPVGELDALLPGEFFSIHGGYSTNDVNADPEVLIPLSTIKELEREGKFGSLYPYLFTTTGNLTALKEARRMGEEIAQEVRARDVDAVIFVST